MAPPPWDDGQGWVGMRTGASLRFLVIAGALALAACANKDQDAYVERPVEALYNTAMDDLAAEDYSKAAKAFDETERQHPYSIWATKAQLMAAYALYQAGNYDESILALDRFIQLHPGHPDVAYAYYMKALDYYVQITDVGRDQRITEDALKTMQEVVRRFPETRYARDARLKIDLTRDHLAGKEMEIGRYYENVGEYLAAINRFRVVVDKFQTTTHVPEALHRLIECYMALGLNDEAQRTASVLGYNYPGSEWYRDSYALVTNSKDLPPDLRAQKGWFAQVIDSIF